MGAQSAPTRSRSTVAFEDEDSNASSGNRASYRPSSAAGVVGAVGGSLSSLRSVGINARPASTGGGRRRPPSATEGDERPKKTGKGGPSKKAKPHLREDLTDPGGIGRWDTLPPCPPEVRMPEELYRTGPPAPGSPPPLPPIPHSLDHFEAMDRAGPKEKGSGMPNLPPRKEDILPPLDDHIFLAVQKQRDKKAAFRQLLS